MNGTTIPKVCFIAPSTCLPRRQKGSLDRAIRLLKKEVGVDIRLPQPVRLLLRRADRSRHGVRRGPVRALQEGHPGAGPHLLGGRRHRAPRTSLRRSTRRITRSSGSGGPSSSDSRISPSSSTRSTYHTRVPAVYFPSLRIGKGQFQEGPAPDHGRGGPVPGRRLADPPSRQEILGHPHRGEPHDLRQFPQPEGPAEVQLEAPYPVHRGHPDRRRGPPPAPGRPPPPPRLQGDPGGRHRLPEHARAEPQFHAGKTRGRPEVRPDLSRRRHPPEAEGRAADAHSGRLQFRPRHRAQPAWRCRSADTSPSPRAGRSSSGCTSRGARRPPDRPVAARAGDPPPISS